MYPNKYDEDMYKERTREEHLDSFYRLASKFNEQGLATCDLSYFISILEEDFDSLSDTEIRYIEKLANEEYWSAYKITEMVSSIRRTRSLKKRGEQ